MIKVDGKSQEAFEVSQKKPVVTIVEYRKFLDDYKTSDEVILKRLEYIETLCRNVIRQELYEYKETPKTNNSRFRRQ